MGAILSVLGWTLIDEEMERKLVSHPRLVMVYPHTSYFDFLYYLLYQHHSPVLHERCRVLINPYWMSVLGPVLKSFGGMAATRREDRGGGAVDRVVRELSGSKFIFLISPKGARDRHRWRSGYYQIARRTEAKVVCAGFDYRRRRFVMGEPFDVSKMTEEEVEARCKRDLASMTPLHPQWSEYPLLAHQVQMDTSAFETEGMLALLSLVLLVLLILILALMNSDGSGRNEGEGRK